MMDIPSLLSTLIEFVIVDDKLDTQTVEKKMERNEVAFQHPLWVLETITFTIFYIPPASSYSPLHSCHR